MQLKETLLQKDSDTLESSTEAIQFLKANLSSEWVAQIFSSTVKFQANLGLDSLENFCRWKDKHSWTEAFSCLPYPPLGIIFQNLQKKKKTHAWFLSFSLSESCSKPSIFVFFALFPTVKFHFWDMMNRHAHSIPNEVIAVLYRIITILSILFSFPFLFSPVSYPELTSSLSCPL